MSSRRKCSVVIRRGGSFSGPRPSSVPYRPCSGTRAEYASRVESGLHRGAPAPSGCCSSVVTRRASPTSAGSRCSCGLPSSGARRNAIHRPSGDQAGALSRGPSVSGRGGVAPVVSTSHSRDR